MLELKNKLPNHTKSIPNVILLIFISTFTFGQSIDTTKGLILKEVSVTAYKEEPLKETSLNIISIKIDSASKLGNYHLTDLLAKTPGVSMLSTGVGIAKPVIRGLYGNRVVVLLSGLKFDNQQWQEEHGLGLSDLGLERVELIKGPMSVLYGTEAIGGIINLIEERKPLPKTSENDFGLKFNSNTFGGLVQAGYKENFGKKWFRIRIGAENNTDYSDGNNTRVLNSRFDGYYLKSTLGFEKKNWTSINNFSSSFNRFGFIFNDVYNFVKPDSRWSRNLGKNPTHLVLLNIFSSENKFLLRDSSKLSLNVGMQSNQRMENEGSGKISLNMHLLTFQYLLKWEKPINKENKIILSNLGSFENNTNFGARKIVPDANMQESNLSIYYEKNIKEVFILENGVGAGQKFIETKLTNTVNSSDKEISPFNKMAYYYNGFSGVSYIPNNQLNFKLNIATGVRIPNLAELSSNGLHEGVFTYEIGNPNLKNEQNISLNFLGNLSTKYIDLRLFSPFYNYFYNYVYLAPIKEDWFGFPVFRYLQQDAFQYGTEFSGSIKVNKKLNFGGSYSGMISKTKDGNFTPFIPAQKITAPINYILEVSKGVKINLRTEVEYCFAQNNVYPKEVKTPEYYLWNVGISTERVFKSKTLQLSINGRNLLDKVYYDHLSRFKYIKFNNKELYNIGRNINFSLNIKWNQNRS